MGFGREVERALDPALPAGRRFRAFSTCVELGGPLGYRATRSYLAERVGLSSDPRTLAPAVAELVAVRGRCQRAGEAYAALRIAAKREGRRTPPERSCTPTWPPRWHGDERGGVPHVLRALLERDPLPAAGIALAEAALAGRLDTDRDRLEALWRHADHRVVVQVHLLVVGPVPLGERLTFRAG
ncbi:hypothetical protein GCM10027418_04820 [Mariniluteicoccus endophyticus]